MRGAWKLWAGVLGISQGIRIQRDGKELVSQSEAPCSCESSNPQWKKPSPRQPMCFFFDLGAGDGQTELAFLGVTNALNNTVNYDTPGFKKEECLSYLVEANPQFQDALDEVAKRVPGKIFPVVQQAIFMCDKAEEKFWIDMQGPHAWGSHLGAEGAPKEQVVKVKLINLMRWLHEGVLPEDTTVLKMDVEGAEFDILPCLVQNAELIKLIDILYLENHCPGGVKCCKDDPNVAGCSNDPQCWCPSLGSSGNSLDALQSAVAKMAEMGVQIPQYNSPY